MSGNLLERAGPARWCRRRSPLLVGLCRGILSCRAAVLVSSMLASCASHHPSQVATPSAPPRGGSVPAVRTDADSLSTGALTVARDAGLSPADLGALAPGPPRVLPGGILFTYAGRPAHTVFVAGTFNGWVPNQHALVRRRAADSLWVGLVSPLPRGRYVYKFLIDGRQWVVDPANPDRGGDGAGGVASVVLVP